jgi:hypothetical protein
MRPVRVAPLFPAAGELVKADRDYGPEQRQAGDQREQQREQPVPERHGGDDQHQHWIEHDEKDDVAAFLQEIGPAFSQRPGQVGATDVANDGGLER